MSLTDEQREVVERVRASMTRLNSSHPGTTRPEPQPRPPRGYTCSHCSGEGHPARSCPTSRRLSRSELAALWLRDHGGSLDSAGAQFGITREAVRQGWARVFPGEPSPLQLERAQNGVAIARLAAEGKTSREIASELGLQAHLVVGWCRHHNVRLTSAFVRSKVKFDAAIAQVVGGSAIIDAALDNGVSYGRLSQLLAERGIRSPLLPGEAGRRRVAGQSRRALASALVDSEGITVAEASRRMRVAASGVYGYRAHNGLPSTRRKP